jgi:translation initiation factor 5B
MKIPVTSINIGPVHKKDVIKAMKSLSGEGHLREMASILAFDVKVTPEAEEYANDNGIKIFTANIIYHLFDQFKEYVEVCKNERKSEESSKAIFPCLLEMIIGAMFHAKDPIVIGVKVKEGVLKVGTPLCIPEKDVLFYLCLPISIEIENWCC